MRPSNGHVHFDLDEVAGETLEIGLAHQRPVDAGRGNFQPVGAVDRLVDVENRRQSPRNGLAVLDRHAAVRALRHDLDGGAVSGRNLNPYKAIAELFDDRLGDMGDARADAGLDNQPGLGRVRGGLRGRFRLECFAVAMFEELCL